MARLHVRLMPKAAVERIDGWDKDEQGRAFLKVRARAAPIEGRANLALIALIAEALKVAKSKSIWYPATLAGSSSLRSTR